MSLAFILPKSEHSNEGRGLRGMASVYNITTKANNLALGSILMTEKFAHLRCGPQEGDVQVQGADLRLQFPNPSFRSQPGSARSWA